MSALRAGYIAPAVRLCPRLCRGLCFAAVGSKVKECRHGRHIFIRWCGSMNVGGAVKSVYGAGAPSAPSEEGAGAPKGFRGATEGERMRGCCLHQGVGVHKVIRVSYRLVLVYTYCFRTYSVYLSFRHGVLILYTPCHLPPQREARRLPPHATESVLWYISIKMCAHGAHTFTFCPKGKKYNLPKGQI